MFWLGIVGGVVLVVGGAVLAAMPYRTVLDEKSPGESIRLDCPAPIRSAANTSPKERLALWATADNGWSGYTLRDGDVTPYCAPTGRRRLALSALAVAAGLVLTLGSAVAMRRRRSAGDQASRSPAAT